MFSSHWWHKLTGVLGSALAILPVVGAFPGVGPVVKVAMTIGGVVMTLATSMEKALGGNSTPPLP